MTDIAFWDAWHTGGGPRYPHEKVVQYCLRTFPSRAGRQGVRALDLGCGSGVHTVFLAAEGFQVTALDPSPVAVANTRALLAAVGMSAEVRQGNHQLEDVADASVQLIVCCGVLDCMGPDAAVTAVRRVVNVLAPGGRGLFLFASDRDFRLQDEDPRHMYGFSAEETQRLFDVAFSEVNLDRYITTYGSGRIEQNDWLVTVTK